ncbi:MAG: hypothetical protein J6A94_08275 [Lachnospiraceae bacterium]|nr:hypothetical protein [Lachnospiraceae bacterium]
MLRNAWYAYGKAYSLENLKRLWNFSAIWIFFYMLFLLPVNILEVQDGKHLALYYLKMLPLMFMILNNALVLLTMPKRMFLCPMNKQQRKKYVLNLFWIKVLVPVLVGIVFNLLELFLFKTSMVYFGSLVIAFFVVNFSTCLFPQLNAREKRKRGWENLIMGASSVWNGINMLLACVQIGLIMYLEKYEKALSMGEGIALGISTVIQILLCILIWKKNMPCIIAEATDYEICFRIRKNSEKNALNRG